MLIGVAFAVTLHAQALPSKESKPSSTCTKESCPDAQLVYFGTRGDGPGKGIAAARFDSATGRLAAIGVVAEIPNPTWLVASPHRPIIYSVSEVGNDGKAEGGVYSFDASKESGALTQISKVGSGGGGATHLVINAKSLPPAILVANYGGGQITVVPLGQRGVLSPVSSTQTDVGSGPSPRQRSAHPHAIAIDPTGRHVLVADLGADRVFLYEFDPSNQSLSKADPASLELPAGSGPRHIIFHPNGRFAYVNGEFTAEIFTLGWDSATGRLQVLKAVPSRGQDYKGDLESAELIISPDGRFLYTSVRGEDVIVVYAVDDKSGTLSEVQRVSSSGKSPVALALDPTLHWLLAANSGSDLVSVFAVDAKSGKLTATAQDLEVAGPASIAFLLH
jgi:6-phosphogluconolactonase